MYYFNKMFFFLIHILLLHIHTNSPFDKTLQKIINFNSSSANKASQLGANLNELCGAKLKSSEELQGKKKKIIGFSSAGKMYICDKCIKSPKSYTQ